MSTVLLSVGDASGDVYASDFVRELAALRPGTRFVGLGGPEMEKAGVEIVVEQSALAVGGLIELLPDLHRVVGAWRRMRAALERERPDLVVLMDSSGFNIPFARRAGRLGIPSLYYVAPQVWVWRKGRVQKIARWVSRVAVIFPFEPDAYAHSSVPVEFVGHPLVDRLRQAKLERGAARSALGLPEEATIVALLPGSRDSEMRRFLPLFLETAKLVHARDPRVHFVLPRASSVEAEGIEARLREAKLPSLMAVEVLAGRAHEVLCAADVALAKPGTSTLEAALLGCPLVVAGFATWFTAFVVRRMMDVDAYAMPNLIAGERIVPELIQEEARPEAIADAVLSLCSGPARELQLARFAELRETLAKGGAARRAAEIAAEMLGEHPAP